MFVCVLVYMYSMYVCMRIRETDISSDLVSFYVLR